MSLEQLLEKVDVDELERRIRSRPRPTTSREFRCPVCNSRCTRLTACRKPATGGTVLDGCGGLGCIESDAHRPSRNAADDEDVRRALEAEVLPSVLMQWGG